ncbi:Signal recognition particle subunit [Dirofilaria immitis]
MGTEENKINHVKSVTARKKSSTIWDRAGEERQEQKAKVKLVMENAESICAEERQELSEENSALEKEWKEALWFVEDKDEDYEIDLYESYSDAEECLFNSCHKTHYVRTFVLEEIDQICPLFEEKREIASSNKEDYWICIPYTEFGQVKQKFARLFKRTIEHPFPMRT